MKKITLILTCLAIFCTTQVKAQTNLQTFYDFGRKHVTTTLEGFYGDKWGNTFFFIDYDYNFRDAEKGKVTSPSGTYYEIARCFNFWQNTKLGGLSLQLEYNGGLGLFQSWDRVYSDGFFNIDNAYLAGLDYFIHSSDFSNTLNLKVLYKKYVTNEQNVPLQFTVVWGMQDLFGVKGLRFSGFADFWWQSGFEPIYGGYTNDPSVKNPEGQTSSTVFLTEPQIWYNVGQHFGCDNLNIGCEIEISNNFTTFGWMVNPCLGAKWVF